MMTNKKKCYIAGGIVAALLIIGGIAWWCLSGNDDKLASALPEDVTMVGRVNAKDLMMQNGLELGDLKNALFSTDNSGVDYSETAFVFASQGYFGAIVPLDDTEKFMTYAHCNVQKQRGLSWGVIAGTFLVAADDEKAIIMGPALGAEQDALRNTLYTCMTQKSGGNESEMFKRLQEREEPVAIATRLSALPASYGDKLNPILPKGVKQENIIVTGGLKTHKNEVTLNLSLASDDEKANRFLDDLDGTLKPIDASLYATAPENPLFHLEAGVNGEKLIELLRQNPDTRTKLLAANMVLDLDMILKSIDGDISLTMPKLGLFDQPMVFQANVQDDKFMQNVMSWNEGATEQAGIKFSSVGNGIYQCSGHDLSYYFGTSNKRLFVTNAEKYVEDTERHNQQLSDTDNCKLYATMNVSSLTDMLTLFSGFGSLSALQSLTLRCQDARNWSLTLQADEGVDILKSLLK